MNNGFVFPPFLGVSPFGPYCIDCSISLAVEKGIYTHGKKFHKDVSFKNAVVVGEVKARIAELRHNHSSDLSQYLVPGSIGQEMWFCTDCFSAFGGKYTNYTRHFKSRCNKECIHIHDKKFLCYATTCGRFGPKSSKKNSVSVESHTLISESTTISSLSRNTAASNVATVVDHDSCKVPPALMTTQEDAMKVLKPFVRPDEDVNVLSLIFYPLLSPDFEGTMREYISFSTKQANEDVILTKWIKAGQLWLTNYASSHIANVSANVRHRLAEFVPHEVDGTTYGTMTFNLRHGVTRLVGDLEAALRFFYRFPTCLFDDFKSDQVKNSDLQWMIERAIIPRILYTAAKEEPVDHGQLPVACRYCLSRGFTIKHQTQLVMNECGWFSSRISAVMHLLRAGVCGYLVTLKVVPGLQVLSLEELEVVTSIQHGRVTNLLAPYIKRLRDLNARKPPEKNNTVNSNGDITAGPFTFPKTIWSTLIPRITHVAKACFTEIFIGTTWEYFLSLPVHVADWIAMEVSVTTSESCISLKDLQVNEHADNLLAQLQSIGELCLFGLGVGAVRHEELTRLKAISFQWHNSYLYYWAESLKQGSLKANKRPRMVEHRLSLTISRIFLLLRYCFMASHVIEPDGLLPCLSGACMLSLIRDIFDFDCLPHKLNVRHFFTSIGNILLPENNGAEMGEGSLVSSISMTEKSGHTQGTGRRAYGTYLEKSEEFLYDFYHKSLGETSLEPPPLAFTPYTDSVLIAGLKELLGRQATFRSRQQQQMVDIAANSTTRHSYVGIPCGHGKSLSWLVPMMASYLSGRNVGTRIVIVPYKFLLGHMVEQARSMIGLLGDRLRIEVLDSTDVGSTKSSLCLEDKVPPALLFVNLDCASSLLKFHMGALQRLGTSKVLHRIYVDELQQLVVEFGFRPAYQLLRELGRTGVPVMCLSGSMPATIAMSLMMYCRLLVSPQIESIETVHGSDPIGDGFYLDVKMVGDIEESIVESILKYNDAACHVICDTKVLVHKVVTLLSSRRKILTVTGDSTSHSQMQCAKDWASGAYDVLVSTVVALVGNENKKCRKIIVGGFLYNVSSLVQAIGRLRPEQRGPGAVVEVICLPFHSKVTKEAKLSDENTFQELLSASCLQEDCREEYYKVFSQVGLQKFLSLKEGCYLQTLSSCYGFARTPCMQCGLCHQTRDTGVASDATKPPSPAVQKRYASDLRCLPENNKRGKLYVESDVAQAKEYAMEARHEEKRIRRLSDSVFRELLYRCILCGSSACIGECGRWCYRCGDPSHDMTRCVYTLKKLALILPNKGVCFGCFDTRQRGIEYHTMKDCPLRRRLRRLLFVDRERRKIAFEPYVRLIYTDEMTFLKVVSTFSNQVTLGRKEKRIIQCQQVPYDTDSAPLLPPDVIHLSKDISVEGTPRSTSFRNSTHARSEYQRLMREKSSYRRRRKFVYGAIHEKLFPGYFEVNPLIRDYDLIVRLDNDTTTTIQVKRITPDDGAARDNLLTEGIMLGRSLKGPGNARGPKVGDLGSMHAIGYRSASTKEMYVMDQELGQKVKVVSCLMRDWMEDNMSSVLKNLVDVDKALNIANSLVCMPSGPGSRMMVSVNLANAHHIDVDDSSMSVALWLEEKPGQAKNWFFVLPNLSHNGSDGVVVRLHHGVAISWDARTVFHCTSKTNVGEDNRVYGCMWGSSKP